MYFVLKFFEDVDLLALQVFKFDWWIVSGWCTHLMEWGLLIEK
jgi:hypothetical protein